MNLFSLNSPFARGANKLVMMLYAGILWFLCSIPIITMGVSSAALYEVLLKAVKNQEGYITGSFFRAFRGNLKQGLQLGIPLTAAQLVFVFNLFYYGVLGGEGFRVQTAVFAVLCLLTLAAFSYVFAVMARYPGWTAAILVLQVLTVFLIWFFVYFPILFIMGISGYMQAAVFDHIFQNLIDKGLIEEEEQ